MVSMPNRRRVRAYDYVNHPYQAVRDTLFAGPLAVFRRATQPASRDEPGVGAELRAKLGPFTVSNEVAVEVGDAIDAVAMHTIAESSVAGVLHDVAGFLRGPGQAV